MHIERMQKPAACAGTTCHKNGTKLLFPNVRGMRKNEKDWLSGVAASGTFIKSKT